MSPNKDETARRIVSDAVVVGLVVKFIVHYVLKRKYTVVVNTKINRLIKYERELGLNGFFCNFSF